MCQSVAMGGGIPALFTAAGAAAGALAAVVAEENDGGGENARRMRRCLKRLEVATSSGTNNHFSRHFPNRYSLKQ